MRSIGEIIMDMEMGEIMAVFMCNSFSEIWTGVNYMIFLMFHDAS